LEHAELAIGTPADGIVGKQPLTDFMAECEAANLGLEFDLGGFDKSMNADVAVVIKVREEQRDEQRDEQRGEQRDVVVKFHNRPLHEVIETEKANGEVVPVPAGYFAHGGAASAL
jgi:hypothetical protein